MSQRNPHGSRQTESHGSKATGIDPPACIVETVVLSCPHLMLSDIRSYVGFSFRSLIEAFNYVLRLDDLALTVIVQRPVRTPVINFFPPFRNCNGFVVSFKRSYSFQHGCQNRTRFTNNRYLDMHVLPYRRRININVNNR